MTERAIAVFNRTAGRCTSVSADRHAMLPPRPRDICATTHVSTVGAKRLNARAAYKFGQFAACPTGRSTRSVYGAAARTASEPPPTGLTGSLRTLRDFHPGCFGRLPRPHSALPRVIVLRRDGSCRRNSGALPHVASVGASRRRECFRVPEAVETKGGCRQETNLGSRVVARRRHAKQLKMNKFSFQPARLSPIADNKLGARSVATAMNSVNH